MGRDNYTRWHRQHCSTERCTVCAVLKNLDDQLDGQDDPAYFEDYHYEQCHLKNCFYCTTYIAICEVANNANQDLKKAGHKLAHVADNDGWKISRCQYPDCPVVLKEKSGFEYASETYPPWHT